MRNRRIMDLVHGEEKVYIYLENRDLCKKFLQDAEEEGFLFGDGEQPTKRDTSDLFRIYADKTLSYVTFIGHMAFGSGSPDIRRIDYKKYVDAEENYDYIK